MLENMMRREGDFFEAYLANRDKFEIQVIYTQINRDSLNQPHFRTFRFNVDSARYFYPASTVKFPMSLLALEKLKKLQVRGLDKYTPMFHDSVYSGQRAVRADTTSANGLPSVAHYVKKILIVSDNDAHNRLYEFLGQRDANVWLNEKGYQIRLLHRLERPLTPDQNRHTEPVRFARHDSVLYQQPMGVNDSIVVTTVVRKGIAYLNNQDSLIQEPFDFSYKNLFPLTEQQRLLRNFLFPETAPEAARFEITADDRQWVLRHMSQLPTETYFPPYAKDTAMYPAWCKFLMFGNDKAPIPSGIRIFNKVGDAYGYLIDNAYVVDFDNQVEFLLSAVILCNEDGIYNDSQYEYEERGFPFMRELGQMVYRYERDRKRKYKPDLSAFRFDYGNDR
ncbi:MAG: class A beta-lactamase-related serine hydrolase [Cyclobacteriaceae bacterium]|nr:class A beta-lactamase-related serine hydrolase [Cyclobacteriaceae bacterium]